jgi:hypothetical protein
MDRPAFLADDNLDRRALDRLVLRGHHYAITQGRDWIWVPALVWSGSMSAVMLVILAEERSGLYHSPHFGSVLLLNLT